MIRKIHQHVSSFKGFYLSFLLIISLVIIGYIFLQAYIANNAYYRDQLQAQQKALEERK